ncbi:MAG: hypothetical protein H3C62_00825 [Gemmatimonadaceae bacterium]|nr:hypothetical protein [Gemmatimonadaceae bacterium]
MRQVDRVRVGRLADRERSATATPLAGHVGADAATQYTRGLPLPIGILAVDGVTQAVLVLEGQRRDTFDQLCGRPQLAEIVALIRTHLNTLRAEYRAPVFWSTPMALLITHAGREGQSELLTQPGAYVEEFAEQHEMLAILSAHADDARTAIEYAGDHRTKTAMLLFQSCHATSGMVFGAIASAVMDRADVR